MRSRQGCHRPQAEFRDGISRLLRLIVTPLFDRKHQDIA